MIDEGQIAGKRSEWRRQRGGEQRTTDWALYIDAETIKYSWPQAQEVGRTVDEDDEDRRRGHVRARDKKGSLDKVDNYNPNINHLTKEPPRFQTQPLRQVPPRFG